MVGVATGVAAADGDGGCDTAPAFGVAAPPLELATMRAAESDRFADSSLLLRTATADGRTRVATAATAAAVSVLEEPFDAFAADDADTREDDAGSISRYFASSPLPLFASNEPLVLLFEDEWCVERDDGKSNAPLFGRVPSGAAGGEPALIGVFGDRRPALATLRIVVVDVVAPLVMVDVEGVILVLLFPFARFDVATDKGGLPETIVEDEEPTRTMGGGPVELLNSGLPPPTLTPTPGPAPVAGVLP